MTPLTVAIAGNPNCGKTTLFNALTGRRQQVGNWPGVTVEKKIGDITHNGVQISLVDLPGVYSLSVVTGAGEAGSLDERLARDYILSEQPDLVINVIDAANLERNLYLTIQLLEMGQPLIVALNMMDVAKARQIRIDINALSERLGCPVVTLIASEDTGVDDLKDHILRAVNAEQVADSHTNNHAQSQLTPWFSPQLEAAISRVEHSIAGSNNVGNPRWLAIKHLEGDDLSADMTNLDVAQVAEQQRAALERDTGMDADTLIACARYDRVAALIGAAQTRDSQIGRTMSDRIDRVVLNRALGLPIFFLVMYLMFMFTINIGGAFIDFFDILAGTIFVDGVGAVLGALGAPALVTTMVADGVGGGIQTVATFVPIVFCLFLFLSILEDSGYMARAAFVMDRFMRMIGLPGKSFVPLLVAFGCNVPAIMATRTLDSQRDRTLTVMMAPFMSCGARLPVYALFAAAFFPIGGQNLVFGLYLLGLFAAVMTGLMLKVTILKGKPEPFVMELPPYHRPTFRGLVTRTWHRLRDFLTEAGQVIVVMVAVLTFLSSWGTDGSFGNADSENSVLAEIGRGLTPIFAPTGIDEDNWPATVGIFTGILAKEAVVGTLNTLYAVPDDGTGAPFSLIGGVRDAVASIGPNLRDAIGMAGDPLGLNIGDVSSIDAAAEAQDVSRSTFGSMVEKFDGKIGAFAYLLMILLYMPCVAAIGAIWRETGWKWAMFASGWTMGLAYGASVLFYQSATFARHPTSSGWWIAGVLGALLVVFATLWRMGKRRPSQVSDMAGAS